MSLSACPRPQSANHGRPEFGEPSLRIGGCSVLDTAWSKCRRLRADRSGSMVTPDPIVVLDGGREVSVSFDEMLNYHGGGSPGGVAHAFKVLERSLPLLDAARR